MSEKTKAGAHLTCLHCNNEWRQRYDEPPKVCPECGTKHWNSESSRPATVQKIPKLAEKSEPEDYFQGVRVLHKNGRYGTIISPKNPLESTTVVTLIVDYNRILVKIPVEKLKIVLEA